MPSRTRTSMSSSPSIVESGDHAGAIERFYTEDASMQENAAAPRVGRDVLVAHERAVLERVKSVTSTCVASVVEGDRVAINWVFEFVYQVRQDRPVRRSRAAGMARRQGVSRAVLLRSVEAGRLMTSADSSASPKQFSISIC